MDRRVGTVLECVTDVERNVVTEPLLRPQESSWGSEKGGGESSRSSEISGRGGGSLGMVLLSSIVAAAGGFEIGSCIGYSAPTQAGITKDIGLSLAEYSVFGSILTIGGMVGAATSGRIADLIGRKGAMGISAIICIVGWLAVYLAEYSLVLYFGRVSSGYGIGVLSYVVPVFIAEIAPMNLRGGLSTLNQLFISVGAATAFIIGTFVTWRTLVLVGLIPCFVLLAGLFFIPESPRWLAKVGREKQFLLALQTLRGTNADISQEAADIQECIEELQLLPKTRFQDLFQSRYIRPVTIGVGLMVFQQFEGVNGVRFYASEVFVSAGFVSGNIGTILIGCTQIPFTALGAILIDMSGRRPLLMVSASGMFLGCFLAGISFYLKSQGLYIEWVPILALSGILVYIGSFSIGMASVPWVIMSEIFPLNMKGMGGSIVTLVCWFGSWAISYTFNFLMSWSTSGTFFLFSAICATSILFVAKVVPETKGRTLEEIQESMNSRTED